MLIFIDTEFTGLSWPAHERKLISLALVTENGRAEWYAEVDGWTDDNCDPWVQKNILPLLTGPSMTRDDARAALQAWFAQQPRQVQVACDSDIDWQFLLDLLGEHPKNLAAQRYDLAPLINTDVYNNTVMAYFDELHDEHRALHDAHAYRLGWLAWMDLKKKGK